AVRIVGCFLLALATPLAGACSPTTRHIAPPAGVQQSAASDVDEAAMRLLRDVTRAAESAGAQAPFVLAYGAGTPGDRLESMVHVPRTSCALFVARATETVEDLD